MGRNVHFAQWTFGVYVRFEKRHSVCFMSWLASPLITAALPARCRVSPEVRPTRSLMRSLQRSLSRARQHVMSYGTGFARYGRARMPTAWLQALGFGIDSNKTMQLNACESYINTIDSAEYSAPGGEEVRSDCRYGQLR